MNIQTQRFKLPCIKVEPYDYERSHKMWLILLKHYKPRLKKLILLAFNLLNDNK
jgi:hypothetical protein